MSLITANTGGSTKRSAVNGIFFISYCVGNIIGPFSFKESGAPRYTSGIIAMLVAYCVEIFLLFTFAFYASMLNRKKESAIERDRISLQDVALQSMDATLADQTDQEDPFFRYSY
jgi:hypothetical protein